jgi:hypothetical protein
MEQEYSKQLYELQQKALTALDEFWDFVMQHDREIRKEALEIAQKEETDIYDNNMGIAVRKPFKCIKYTEIEFTFINGAKEKWPHMMYLTKNGWVNHYPDNEDYSPAKCGYNVPEKAFINSIMSNMPI